MSYTDFLIRISICFVLGIIIGLERQFRRKTAGIRTISLVSIGSFLFVSISELAGGLDVTRIAAQVVSGIGFLGAGVILRDGTNIRGLNTAATLWCSAAIGALTALGLLLEATIGVVYILMSNILLRFISRKLLRHTLHTKIINYNLNIYCKVEKENSIKNTLMQYIKAKQITIKSFSSKALETQIQLEVDIEIESILQNDITNLINKLCVEDGVISIKYNNKENYVEDDDDDYEEK